MTLGGNLEEFVYYDLIPEDIKIIQTRIKKLRYVLFELIKIIKKENPDIMFTTLVTSNYILTLSKILSNIKSTLIIREAVNRTSMKKASFISKKITNILYNKADLVIALSKGVKEDLVKSFRINKNKIRVIYNPIDTKMIEEMKNEQQSDIIKKGNEKIIIAVGRLVDSKDYPTLLKAFDIVSKRINSKLFILGIGKKKSYLIKVIKELKLKNNVMLLGFKKNPYKYLNCADVFVLSSNREGFAHVIVEAMTVGIPVVSTDCNSGPREILMNNIYGDLVEVGDYKKMAERIFDNLTKKNTKVNSAKKRALEFDVKKIITQYEDVFDSF